MDAVRREQADAIGYLVPQFADLMAGATAALVGNEEKRFVFEDWATKYSAKVILLFLGLSQSIEIHKPIPGIQHAVPETLEQSAMKGIGSRTRYDGDLSARGTSELGSK